MQIIQSSLEDTTNYASNDQLLKVNSCGVTLRSGRAAHNSYSLRRPQGRKDYQLLYIVQGQGQFYLCGAWQTVQSGQAVLYQPGEPQFYTFPADTPIQCKWIHFTGSEAFSVLEKSGLIAAAPLMKIGENREISLLYDRIIQERVQLLPGQALLSQALLFELLALFGRQIAMSQRAGQYKTRQKIMQAAEYIHVHFSQPLSLEELALQHGMSKYHFAHAFRACMGQSPHAYIAALRMAQARELLERSDLSIGKIALECGYENPLYFSRAFSSHFGCSPQQFRLQSAVSNPPL